MDLFKKNKRGLVHFIGIGMGLINKGEKVDTMIEVEILKEIKDYYKIKYIDAPGQIDREWVKKEEVIFE